MKKISISELNPFYTAGLENAFSEPQSYMEKISISDLNPFRPVVALFFRPAKCLLLIVHAGQNEQVYHSRALVPKISLKWNFHHIALRFRKRVFYAFGIKSNIRTLGLENPRSFSSLGPR
jgi:hypothetical protein